MTDYEEHPGFLMDTAASSAYQADLEAALGNPLRKKRTLEMGCGSGSFTKFLSSQGLYVTTVDSNEAQLAHARHTLPGVEFIAGDIESSNFASTLIATHGLFDLLIACYVIHEMYDPIDTFRSWKPLLAPNRKIILIENCWVRSDWGWNEWGKHSNELPLACTQTWATAAYCLKKGRLHHLNVPVDAHRHSVGSNTHGQRLSPVCDCCQNATLIYEYFGDPNILRILPLTCRRNLFS